MLSPQDEEFLQVLDLSIQEKWFCGIKESEMKRLLRIVAELKKSLERERAYVNQDIRGGYALADMKQEQLDQVIKERDGLREKVKNLEEDIKDLAG